MTLTPGDSTTPCVSRPRRVSSEIELLTPGSSGHGCLSREPSSDLNQSTTSQAGGSMPDENNNPENDNNNNSVDAQACETPTRPRQPTSTTTNCLSQTKTTASRAATKASITYRTGQLLGQAAAKVYQATVISSNVDAAPRGSSVAVKIYDTAKWKNDQFRFARSEVKIMSQMDHPNIAKCYSYEYTDGSKTQSGARRSPYGCYGYNYGRKRSTPQLKIVQELCSKKDLFSNVQKYGALPAALASHYFRKLLKAIKYMHSNRVAHRDLKLENIVYDNEYNLKVIDFGHAISWDANVVQPKQRQCAGTERYRTPEVQRLAEPPRKGQGASSSPARRTRTTPMPWEQAGDGSYDPRQSDTWAAAIVFFELLLGYPPMSKSCAHSDWYFQKIAYGRWEKFWTQHETMCKSKGAKQLAKLTPEMRKFFEAAFDPDPSKRPTVQQLLEHDYLWNPEQGQDENRSVDSARTILSDEQVLAMMRKRCR